MKPFPWWTEEHIAFQKEVSAFAKEIAPRDAVTRWTREFPYDIYRKIGVHKKQALIELLDEIRDEGR